MPLLFYSLLLLPFLSFSQTGKTSLSAHFSSEFTLPGEPNILFLHLKNTRLPGLPIIPQLSSDYSFSPIRNTVLGETESFYLYSISKTQLGQAKLSGIYMLDQNSRKLEANVASFQVVPTNQLIWRKFPSSPDQNYGIGLFTKKQLVYEGETQSIELKILIPTSYKIQEWSVIQLNGENLSAWNLEKGLFRMIPTWENTQGKFYVFSWKSHFTILKSGKTTIATSPIRAIVSSSLWGTSFFNLQKMVLAPVSISLDARSLPKPMPTDFTGAIGKFQLNVEAQTQHWQLNQASHISVEISGSGNLSSIPVPNFTNTNHWKTYHPTRITPENRKGDWRGKIEFSQLVKPLANVTEIPSLQLHYFNPDTHKYEVANSKAIPIKLSQSTASHLNITLNHHNDLWESPPRSNKLWMLISSLLLAGVTICLTFKYSLFRRPPKTVRDSLKALEIITDEKEFYFQLAQIIENHLPPPYPQEIQDIIDRKNVMLYSQQPYASTKLDDTQKNQLILKIKKFTLIFSLLLLGISSSVVSAKSLPIEETADEYWKNHNYKSIIKLYTHTDLGLTHHSYAIFHNLGLAYQSSENPGKAILFYYRSLIKKPFASPSLAPLKKLISTPLSPPLTLGKIYLSSYFYANWKHWILYSLFITLLGLILWIKSPYLLVRKISKPLTVLFCLITLCFLIPSLLRLFSPTTIGPLRKVYFTTQKQSSNLYPLPLLSKPITQLKPGTAVFLLAKRDKWLYFQLTNEEKAWGRQKDFQPLIE